MKSHSIVLCGCLTAVAALSVGSNTDAYAQAASQTAQAAPAVVEEVVITGSRIVRDGYQAPTPVSVLSAEDLNAAAATNIADAVNRLPAFAASVTPHNSSTSISSGTAGINNLNLRGLGPTRTLVLLDGQRVVGSTLTGFNNNGSAVDVNVFPDSLISRVDVVTGGASAAYGSDALAGVVNFVIDHNFTGVRGTVEGGVTTYGDDRNWNISLTAGMPFANDRGHFLISGQASSIDGIHNNPRPWAAHPLLIISNPSATATNGQPSLLVARDAAMSIATGGGLVLAGPLRGVMFGPGGTPSIFRFGQYDSGFTMQGGDWALSRIDNAPDLDIKMARQTAFTRLSYDLTDNIQAFVQLQWAYAHSSVSSVPNFELGTAVVTSDNPFIPASIQAAMTASKQTSLVLGTNSADIPPLGADNGRTFRRLVVGANGKLDAFDSGWTWDAYYQQSRTHLSVRAPFDHVNAIYQQAIDAVRNPATGAIVCRSTLTAPNNGCVPFNPMGIGVNSQAAINYVTRTGYAASVLRQDVAAATVRGEPFASWAGQISLATGIEWRHEQVSGIASALDEANAFFAGNYHASKGQYDVTEGFAETVIPLAKNTAWAKSLDLNAAVRATSYTSSGYVTTWKAGLTYAPIDDLNFRATRSRDIRAPNLGDLYSAGQSGTGVVIDPSNGRNTTINSPVSGNPTLKPEVADTTGVGVVLAPRFFPGFGASVDYYNIDISGAISSLSPQQVVDRCFGGNTFLCTFIRRDAQGLISFIANQPFNVLSQSNRGLDMEASYRLPLQSVNSDWGGDLTLRALGTYMISLKTIDLQSVTEGAGINGDGLPTLFAPKFRWTASAAYATDPITLTLTARGISSGKYVNEYIQCTSGCPASTAAHPTINDNHIAAVVYWDMAFNYKIAKDDHKDIEAFLVIENAFNRDPPAAAGDPNNGFYAGQGNASLYDRLGRTFRTGVRFKM